MIRYELKRKLLFELTSRSWASISLLYFHVTYSTTLVGTALHQHRIYSLTTAIQSDEQDS